MNKSINRVKLYVKDNLKAHELEKRVKEELIKNKFEIVNSDFELAIAIGGDGTFLKMVHDIKFSSCYYASINAGSLGFFSAIKESELSNFISNLKNNIFQTKELNLLDSTIYFNDTKWNYYSINELTIRKSDFSSLRCQIFIDDKLLDKYIGDGLVISSPIGSTGYNLALGGPIIDNTIEALSITPIAPINNQVYRSITNSMIIGSNHVITIVFDDTNNISILSDGKMDSMLKINKIECILSNKTIKCLFPNSYSYIDTIKSKIIDTKD